MVVLDTRFVLLVLSTENRMLLLDCSDQTKTLRTKARCFVLLEFFTV